MLKEYDGCKSLKYVILMSRRIGKTYALVTLAIEHALRKPNQYIKYATTTNEAVFEMVMPAFTRILESCPEEYKPQYNIARHKWTFHNGSEILLKGVDKDKGEGLRGQGADLAIIDEAGFVDCLDTLIKDVLVPMIIERGGRILLSSTPPKENTHPFLFYIAEAERTRSLTKRVITDCPRFTKKQIETFIEETGGLEAEACRRELFCECIRDTSMAIVPEFTEDLSKKIIYDTAPELTYFPDCYVSLDPGFADNAAALFGYWDFPTATLYIQSEYVASGLNTEELAKTIKSIESNLWQDRKPYRRVSDTDLRLIQDLKDLHRLKFIKTEKDNKEAQINELRIMVKNKQIKIHKSCLNLITQLRYGQFKVSSSGRRDFKRTEALSHCDTIDALLYLVRNLNRTRNPITEETPNQFFHVGNWDEPRMKQTNNAKRLAKAFRRN